MAGLSDEEKKIIRKKTTPKRLATWKRNIQENPELLEKYKTNMLKVRVQPSNKNRKYYTDGINVVFLLDEQTVPDGYIEGTPKNYHQKSGFVFYNNGKTNIKLFDGDEVPDGFVKGRFLKQEKKFKGHSSDTLKKMSTARKNSMWTTNGNTNKLVFDGDEPLSGFRPGFYRKPKETKVFVFNLKTHECKQINKTTTVPDGWALGRGPKWKNKTK